ncbi:osteoglycin, paralog a [Callorhinchus milii]|uniref:Mimecan n=1 Tax=Callorhinchus milii TaxID=7868 RepID=A0A4W3HRU4_CALMI|nr:osteoglycin, paralog a [Callorhinchus milii]|eukprot:gi/632980504/ref/XP_007907071.1/ PREDICTED: mimecan [Callorhinchus milii]
MKGLCPVVLLVVFADIAFTAPAHTEDLFHVSDLEMDFGTETSYEYQDEPQEIKQVKPEERATPVVAANVNSELETTNPEEDSNSEVPDAEMPTCLLCVCLIGSVYCEETDIESIPVLPKETGYLYARFNEIKKVTVNNFADITSLRTIDLTGNMISEIEDKAFSQLPDLEVLILSENNLLRLPTLPPKLTILNAEYNRIKSNGIKKNAFKNLPAFQYLYLGHNQLDKVPVNIPDTLRILHLQHNNITTISDDTFCKPHDSRYIRYILDEIRLEGNPINLAEYPNSYICLPRLPIGRLR